MSLLDDPSPDPRHRMLLSIQYTERGGVGHVEAIAVPTWRDRAIDSPFPEPPACPLHAPASDRPPLSSPVCPGPLSAKEDVTLLFVPGARLILRFDDDLPHTR